MPGKPGLGSKSGQRVFDDVSVRESYLAALRMGHGRAKAAEVVGVAYSTVWRYFEANPKFLHQVQDAEAERSAAALKFLEETYQDEMVPHKDRISAADKVVKYTIRDQKNDHKVVDVTVTHEIGGDQLERVLELQKALEERKELDVIDVEVLEDE